MPVNIPPMTGNPEVDQFNYDVAQELNSLAPGGAASITVSTDDQGRPEIGNTFFTYQHRYLEVAYGTDQNGANFAETIRELPTGSTEIWQGLRNQPTQIASTNPADFSWRRIEHTATSTTLNAFYSIVGGRQVDWLFSPQSAAPDGYTLEDTGSPIDLDDFIIRGRAGETPIAYYSANALNNRPSTTPPSTEWVTAEDRDANTIYNWVVWGNTGGDGEPSIFDFTATGITGQSVMASGAQAETGTITVDSTATTGTGVVATREEIELEITPEELSPVALTATQLNTVGQTMVVDLVFAADWNFNFSTTANVNISVNSQSFGVQTINVTLNGVVGPFADFNAFATQFANLTSTNSGSNYVEPNQITATLDANTRTLRIAMVRRNFGLTGDSSITGFSSVSFASRAQGVTAPAGITDGVARFGGTGVSGSTAPTAPYFLAVNDTITLAIDTSTWRQTSNIRIQFNFDQTPIQFIFVGQSPADTATDAEIASYFATTIVGIRSVRDANGNTASINFTNARAGGTNEVLIDVTAFFVPGGFQGINVVRWTGVTSPFTDIDPLSIAPVVTTPSQIRIQETALMVDETITLEPNLTTQLAIEQDFRTKFNANTNLRMHFDEMAAVTADDHPTIVYSTGGVREDTALILTEIDNSGGLDVMQTVTVQGAAGSYVQAVLQITYDGGQSNVMFPQSQSAAQIAAAIATELNGLSQYSSTANGNVVTFTRSTAGALGSNLAISVTTAGSPMFDADTFTLNLTPGSNVRMAGSPGSYRVVIDGTAYTGTLVNRSAAQIIDDLRAVLTNDPDGVFTARELSPVTMRATARENRAATLAITITPGENYDADTDTTTAATATLTRVVRDAGTNPAFVPNAISQLRGEPGPGGPFRIDIFRRSTTVPAEPTGGNRTTAPTGWSFTAPMGTDRLYTSFVIFNPVNDTPTTDLGTRWAPPFEAGGTGPAGSDGTGSQVRIIYHNNARTSQPSLPTAANLVDNGWTIVPATNSNWFAEQVNTTSADGTTVATYGTWRGPILITGADGVNPTVQDNGDGTHTVTDGDGNTVVITDGDNGDLQNLIFRRSGTAPATPQPSPGVPTGWFDEVSNVPAGAGEIFASFGRQVRAAGNFTWQAPVRVTAVDGLDGQDGISPTVMQVQGGAMITDAGGSTAMINDGAAGADGADGSTNDFIFQRATSQPDTPSPSAGIPTGWFGELSNVPSAGTGLIWTSIGTRASGATNFVWQEPSRIEGADGTNGQDGRSTVTLVIYRRSATAITTAPTGGSYDIATAVLSNPPSGWSTMIPSGTDPVYGAIATVSVTGNTGTAAPTWSVPEVVYRDGDQGPQGIQGPRGNDGTDGTNGMDGTDGMNGESSRIDIAYADDRTGTNAQYPSGTGTTYTPATPLTSNDFIGQMLVTWTAGSAEPPPSTVASNYSWQETRGQQGPRGNDGADGQRTQIFGVRGTAPELIFDYDNRETLATFRRVILSGTFRNAVVSFPTPTFGIQGSAGSTTGIRFASSYPGAIPPLGSMSVFVSGQFASPPFSDTLRVGLTFNEATIDPVAGTARSGSLTLTGSLASSLGLSNTYVEQQFVANNLRGYTASIDGDTIFIEGVQGPVAYIAQGNGVWQEQTAGYLDGNLLVSGTLTADKLRAGTITAESGVIGSLNADLITAGTINAQRLLVDGTSITPNDAGQLAVIVDSGTGLVSGPSGLALNTDPASFAVTADGRLQAVNIPIESTTIGTGTNARNYDFTVTVPSTISGQTLFYARPFIRIDTQAAGIANPIDIAISQLANFSFSATWRAPLPDPSLFAVRHTWTIGLRSSSSPDTGAIPGVNSIYGYTLIGHVVGGRTGNGSFALTQNDAQRFRPGAADRYIFLDMIYTAAEAQLQGELTLHPRFTVNATTNATLTLGVENGTRQTANILRASQL